MPKTTQEFAKEQRRTHRVRMSLRTNQELPRLSVHRTLRHIYAQIIDDLSGKTLASVSDLSVKAKGKKSDVAREVGSKIAELAKEKKVTAVRFDRGGRKFHGRIAALADAAREAGLKF
jgi:large subunit ribosomal protein L18